ncbi:MAG: HlyD family efflux transporter periplasmic adaptor subunit [Thermoanaerobaculia bacterium]
MKSLLPNRRRFERSGGLAVAIGCAFLFAASAPSSSQIAGVARLTAPPEATMPLKARATLEVRALPVTPGVPVAEGRILVEQDTAILEGRLAKRQQELTGMQAENRQTAVGARQGTREIDQPEVQAAREILDLQAEITAATTVAPADGYVLRHHYAVGARAKRRKPLLDFVPAKATVVELSLPAAAASRFPAGAAVRIASSGGSTASFEGTILSATPTDDDVALRIRPEGLPFLPLDRPTDIVLAPAD